MTVCPDKNIVPLAVIKRLPMYYRQLRTLKEQQRVRISSRELSGMIGITSSLLRQDLNYFGDFGQQGYGYKVEDLYNIIGDILGIGKEYPAVLVGLGNLGRALINYEGFRKRGLVLKALFDNDPSLQDTKYAGLPVKGADRLYEYLKHENIEVGIITTPASAAQEIAETLELGGVKGIWNFAPCIVNSGSGIIVENTHIGDSMLTLFYKMKNAEN